MKKALQETLMKLRSVFPEAVTESQRIDEDGKPHYVYALKEEFIELLQEGGLDIANDQQNRYELQFPGKHTAKALAYMPSYKTLVADRGQSKRFDETGNLFIEGDNLDVLRMLQRSYRGRIKMIYIDPPYNTGCDDFIYSDDFSIRQREYLNAAGILDENGARQIDELQNGLRGRFHAGWLAMIYPRLKLARELLSEDGVIFISIDDNEQANLKLLCDEIFGEENFVSDFVVVRAEGGGLAKQVIKGHDNLLAYAKNISEFSPLKKPKDIRGKIINKDGAEYWIEEDWLRKEFGKYGTCYYEEILEYKGKEKKKEIDQGLAQEIYQLIRKENGMHIVGRLRLLGEDGSKFYSVLKHLNAAGINDLKGIKFEQYFDYPKPVSLLRELVCGVTFGSRKDSGDIILDFFAGSATTAHAVMQLNAEDGGKRKFIMVQWAESIDPKKAKEAHSFCTEKLKRPATIAEIAKERIRRAGAKICADHPDRQIDDGFRVFTVQDSLLSSDNRQRFDQTEQWQLSTFKTDLAKEKFEPLLYEALLQTGAALDAPLALYEIEGYPFAICERRCYCVTENLTQPIVRKIAEQQGDQFDILYYLSDCPAPTTSYTELKSAIQLASGDKGIEALAFY